MSPPFHYTGVIPSLALPFHDDESFAFESLERLIRFNAAAGVDGITIPGLPGATFPGVDLTQPLTIAV